MYAPGPRELQTEGIDAESFEVLAGIAVERLQQQKEKLGMVCGPITTGGTNNQVHNFEIFNATVRGLERSGKPLFNQVPYEFGLRRLAYTWEAAGNSGYCMPILTVFYARVFESGFVNCAWFIPGWQSSFGARWEREKLSAEKATVIDLSRAEIHQFLQQEHAPEHVSKVMALLAA